MLTSERQQQILNILQLRRRSNVTELSKLLYTSPSTIRRILVEMENLRLVKRKYGEVEICESNAFVIPQNLRLNKDALLKKRLAKKAASLVKDGSVIFLDHSSTCIHLAFELTQKKEITVITNNIDIVMYLKDFSINVICSGGIVCPKDVDALVGMEAEQTFENTRADLAFFSTRSLSADGTIYDCVYETVALRKKLLKNAKQKVYLCTENKIGTESTYKQCTLADIDYLVCDSEKAHNFADEFENLRIL